MKKDDEAVVKMVQVQSLQLKSKNMKLRKWLEKVRLSITELSKLLGVSRSYIHMILMGVKVPSQDLLDRVRFMSMDKVKNFSDLVD